MADPEEIWISDSCIIIDLHNAGILPLLFRLNYTIKTTDFVINELKSINDDLLKDFDIVTTSEEEMLELYTIRGLHMSLSITDVSVYHHAKKSGLILITGDNTLRKLAIKEKVKVHGILWVLDEFVNSGCLSPGEAIDSLNKILNLGGRLPEEECGKMVDGWKKG